MTYQIIGRKKNRKTEFEGKKFKTKASGVKAINRFKREAKKLVKSGKAKQKDVLILKLRKVK